MIRVAILAPALALRIGLHEVLRGLPDVEMLADSALPQELPAADVWVVTSADFIDELNEEQTPPLLLVTGNPQEAARLGRLAGLGRPAPGCQRGGVLGGPACPGGGPVGRFSPALVQALLERHRAARAAKKPNRWLTL